MSEYVLDVRDLGIEFATEEKLVKAVDGVTFQLMPGQTLGIVGESGSGKSVTALAIMGLLPSPPARVVSGVIDFRESLSTAQRLDAINLLQLPPQEMQRYRGSQISMIFQEPMSSLNPVYTCGFQLTEALRLHQKLSSAAARRQACALLQEVKLIPSDQELRTHFQQQLASTTQNLPAQLTKEQATKLEQHVEQQIHDHKLAFLGRYPHQLSGGQIQRVMIAIAISCNPTILIADEPTTALDVTVQATILDLLAELRDRRQMSIIFVSHDLGIISEIADQVAVMYQGKIVEAGPIDQILHYPQHPYTKGLLNCRPQPQRQIKYLPTVSDFMEVARDPQGGIVLREKEQTPATLETIEISDQELAQRQAALEQQPPLLRVEHLCVYYPVQGLFGQTQRYVAAVNDVSFAVYPGETLGLVGESGCGKTTLGRSLLRLIEPTSGEIYFEGQEITQLGRIPLRQLRRNLQIIFQDPYSALDPRMNIAAAVMEPVRIYQPRLPRQTLRERAATLLEKVGLGAECLNRYPHQFSGGQRQRICIARALALNPKFIICDESVSALDVSVQAQVLNLLKALQAELNLTYIFISHDLSVVKFMSDRIMVMKQGQIEETGSAQSIYYHPQQPYTRQLIASIPSGASRRQDQTQSVSSLTGDQS
jgi:peptide/nickel transport system ATP-binding protein